MLAAFTFEMQQDLVEVDWLATQLMRAGVCSLLTIGVFHGGVEWRLARRFQQANQPLVIHAVDPYESPAHPYVLKMVEEQCPLVKVSFNYCKSEEFGHELYAYDAVFVDGDHTEPHVRHDTQLAIDHPTAYVLAMHDIMPDVPRNPCRKVWLELKGRYPNHAELAMREDMGIGIVHLGRKG